MSGWHWLDRMRGRQERLARDLDDEIALHIELRTKALIGEGLGEVEARRAAIRRFGSGQRVREGLRLAAQRRERRMWLRRVWTGLKQDTGYAVRGIAREPAFSAVVVITLALGIGANATMFGLIDRLLLRGPDHVESASDIYRFYMVGAGPTGEQRITDGLGYVSYVAFRDRTRSFDGVAAFLRWDGRIGQGSAAERANVGAATADFFPLLGVSTHLGRFWDEAEDRPPAGTDVAVLGYDLWQRRFGGDRAVLGETVLVNDQSYTVIGIAPRGFTGIELTPVDVWLPMSAVSRGITQNWPESWRAQWLRVVGRLRSGVTVEQADVDATAAHRAAYTGPEERMREAGASIRPAYYNRQGQEPLGAVVARWLLAVASIVLLIACANVMNLLLARATRRRRDAAIRLAIGIGRPRLFRMHVLHGLVLAAAGGALGLFITAVIGPAVRVTLLPEIAWSSGPVDGRLLLFTTVAVLVVAALTSIVPALRAGSQDVSVGLRSGVREGGGRRSALRTGLTLGQVTLTFVLLVGAGLFARSLSTVRSLDLGIEPDRVLALSVDWVLPASTAERGSEEAMAANRDRRLTYYERALERARSLPGVASAAIAVGTPFKSSFTIAVRAAGYDTIPPLAGGGPYVAAVTEGFFETTGLDMVEGRPFTAADRANSEPVAIVNRTMADALWPGGALDECLWVIQDRPDAPCSRIVGIVEDAHRFGLREAAAMQYYIPRGQERGFSDDRLLVRPAGRSDDPLLIGALRSALNDLDPGLSFVTVSSLQEEVDPQVRPWLLGTTLFSLFGGLALLIAGIGLYSVIAYMVADRTHEMGVRKVLGADTRAVLGLVLGHGAWRVGLAMVLGTIIALIAGRFIQPALFETSARDPFVFLSVAVLTLAASVAATIVPAWRAGRVDPVVALRTD